LFRTHNDADDVVPESQTIKSEFSSKPSEAIRASQNDAMHFSLVNLLQASFAASRQAAISCSSHLARS
jgi:hypothetical protein